MIRFAKVKVLEKAEKWLEIPKVGSISNRATNPGLNDNRDIMWVGLILHRAPTSRPNDNHDIQCQP